MATVTEKAEFQGADGASLAARIDRPRGPIRAWALFAHCFSCSKDVVAARRIAQHLAERGIAVLRFDFTGLGNSEGDFANTNFSTNIADLERAAAFLRDRGTPASVLIGHSLGGAAVVVAATRLPEVRAVVTIAAPADAAHVKANFCDAVPEIEARGEAKVSLAGRPFTIKRQFLDDLEGHKVEDAAAALDRPLLVCHSPLDGTVGVDNATRLFLAAKHPKSFIGLDQADHLLTKPTDALHVADVIAGWAARYAGDARPTPPRPTEGPSGVTVAESGAGRYTNYVVAGEHVLVADEPAKLGGDDAGPNPYSLLNAALGACTSMTMRMYAERKGWPLERVTVRLTHEKTHAEDCVACDEDEKARVDVFEREIVMTGALDEAQRARLMEIADKCPVHRTLHAPVVVRTRAREAEEA